MLVDAHSKKPEPFDSGFDYTDRLISRTIQNKNDFGLDLKRLEHHVHAGDFANSSFRHIHSNDHS